MKSILLVGRPNSGKSLLYNVLTGQHQKVSNYPGTTVEIKTGKKNGISFTDFPGMYSFFPSLQDEKIAKQELQKAFERPNPTEAILITVEGSRFQEGLNFGLQVKKEADKHGKPVIFVVTMLDELEQHNDKVDIEGVSKETGCPVIAVSAKKLKNINKLRSLIDQVLANAVSYLTIQKTKVIDDYRKPAREIHRKYGPKSDLFIKKQMGIDKIILNRLWGGLIFFGIIIFMFQSIFTWSAPLIEGVDTIISFLGEFVYQYLPAGFIASFVKDGLIGGIGSFLVFIPQIFIMFFIIYLLEESGYMARSAVICHKPLKLFGLSGKSFFPMLSGYACAIPAIMATRSIETPKARFLTMISIPLLTCSARLPVYSLIVAAVIPAHYYLGGIIGLQGLVFFLLYIGGLMIGLIITGIISRFKKYDTSQDKPFILELPPYRIPSIRMVTKNALRSSKHFITKAGLIIFTLTVLIWFLGYFPSGEGHLEESFLGTMGHFIEPVMGWIGLDWKYGTAILLSFVAREVFVGTLGVLFGIENVDGEQFGGLVNEITSSGLSFSSGLALLVFYSVALQCTSTLAILKKESGNSRLPIYLLIGYSLLAYALAFLVYQIANLF